MSDRRTHGTKHLSIFLAICSLHVTPAIEARTGVIETYSSLAKPKDWNDLCPYSAFCKHLASKKFPISYSGTKKPCCGSCSCADDCGLYRTCCHHSVDKYRLDETYKTRCQSLTTAPEDENMFYVVDRCPNSTSCHKVRTATWGSMHPVSSYTTRMIYLNEQCAKCNGEGLFTKWDTELKCDADLNDDILLSTAIDSALQGQARKQTCSLKFLPPATIDVEFHRCSLKPIIRNCEAGQSFDLETEEQCKSYNATFSNQKGDTIFANIHCFLCNNHQPITVCDVEDAKRTVLPSFSFFLSSRQITQITQKNSRETKRGKGCNYNEMEEKRTGICRRIHCPIGMTELDGKCSYISETWTAGPFWSVVKLQSMNEQVAIPREDIEAEGTYLFNDILKDWSKELFIAKNASYIDYIIVRLRHKRKKVIIQDFMNSIQSSFNNYLNISIKGKLFQMKASFNKFFDYSPCNSSGEETLFSKGDRNDCTDIEGREKLETLHETDFWFNRPDMGIPFTKFFMCHVVDLKPGEYHKQGTKLFFKITNETFEKIQYRTRPCSNSTEIVSLCVSDFGEDFWVKRSSANNLGWHTYFLNGFLLILINPFDVIGV